MGRLIGGRGGRVHNSAGRDGGVASQGEPKQRTDQRAGPAPFSILKGRIDVLGPDLTWMGLPKREESIGAWCLQSPEALDPDRSPHRSALRD